MIHHFITKLIAIVVALFCLSACTVNGDDIDEYGSGLLQKGTPAPDFTIYTDSHPEGFALSSLQGQYVVVP